MIIDVHTHLAYQHIFPAAFMEGVCQDLLGHHPDQAALIRRLAGSMLRDKDGNLALQQMDEADIDKCVLLIADFGYALGEAALSIEAIFALHAEVVAACPDRFVVFGGVDPRRGRAGVDLFEKYLSVSGFKGLKLYPPCGFELDHPGLYPLYELCAQYRIPVLTHTGPSLRVMRTEQRYPATIRQVAAEFPAVNFILAHGGARDWETSVAVARSRPNVSFDISTFQTTTTCPRALKQRFRYFFDQAPDQVLFGSDWPMFLMSFSQKQLVELIVGLDALNDQELEKLFSGNARAILRWD